ncbi:MAG: asparagine synthase (glutamine-hydrolyzing) [Prosthecobacter sp.]
MCGILAAAKLAPESERAFGAALMLQRHRGPDGQRVERFGPSVLGFARLSIIDLSECSMQPFHHQHITLVMNGEIYNYLELRERLAHEGAEFTSHGDAEALAAAIAHWGPERAFREARGMWACVAHDANKGVLYAARDRVGIKPLWWANTKDGLIFSSEVKSILAMDPAMREIDVATASAFVAHGVQDEHDRSFYRHIRSFTAGHWAEIKPEDSRVQSHPFWELKMEASDQPQSIQELRECLAKTVALHMQADVPVGLTLSGGLDSTLLCYDAMQAGNLACYSLDHPVANAENHIIDETVKLWGLKHKYVPCADAETVGCIDELLRLMDQPFRATQTLYQYAIRKAAAADGVRVLITGDGADEVFGGYTEAVPHAIAGQLRRGRITEAVALAAGMEEFTGRHPSDLIKRAEKILVENDAGRNPVARVPAFDASPFLTARASTTNPFDTPLFPSRNLKEYLAYRLFKTPMPYWLRVEDGTSMGVSIETRVPFLDHVLIEAAFAWPEEEFLAGFKNKSLLRRAGAGILPDHVANQAKKYQRPGSSQRLVFQSLPQEILATFEMEDPSGILETKACREAFARELAEGHTANADFWFRAFLYLRWSLLQ